MFTAPPTRLRTPLTLMLVAVALAAAGCTTEPTAVSPSFAKGARSATCQSGTINFGTAYYGQVTYNQVPAVGVTFTDGTNTYTSILSSGNVRSDIFTVYFVPFEATSATLINAQGAAMLTVPCTTGIPL